VANRLISQIGRRQTVMSQTAVDEFQSAVARLAGRAKVRAGQRHIGRQPRAYAGKSMPTSLAPLCQGAGSGKVLGCWLADPGSGLPTEPRRTRSASMACLRSVASLARGRPRQRAPITVEITQKAYLSPMVHLLVDQAREDAVHRPMPT